MVQHMKLHHAKPDGSTIYQHCVVIYEETGKWPEEYEEPEIPENGQYLWDWYWELRQAAPIGMAGPGPLVYSEILAWRDLFQVKISPMQMDILMALDRKYLDYWYEEQKKLTKPKK